MVNLSDDPCGRGEIDIKMVNYNEDDLDSKCTMMAIQGVDIEAPDPNPDDDKCTYWAFCNK